MASTPPVKFLVTLLKMVENGDVLFDDGEPPRLIAYKLRVGWSEERERLA